MHNLCMYPGRETAKKVKEAGRGSHVTLGCEGSEFTRSSRYQTEFCAQHKEGGGEAIKQVTANMVRRRTCVRHSSSLNSGNKPAFTLKPAVATSTGTPGRFVVLWLAACCCEPQRRPFPAGCWLASYV